MQEKPERPTREPRKTQAVIESRVAVVYSLVSRKTQRAAIAAEIAKEVKKEAERIAEIPKPGDSEESKAAYEKAVSDATVWGESPPPMRTLDAYIAKAKKIYESAGATLDKRGNFIFGVIFARNFEVYDRALEAGNLNTAQRANEQLADLFGLNGAIKLHLTTDAPADGVEKGTAEMTLPQIVAEMRRIKNAASLRRLAAAEPQEIQAREA